MYKDIISLENLCQAWSEFIRGKHHKKDVAVFSLNLSQNLFDLHNDLVMKTYRHGAYEAFSINDPKPRSIHKATVRDRVLHHAIYRILYPYFDRLFIHDSYSCRKAKGTHKAIAHFQSFTRKVSKNNTRTCWVLKCDIKKFFASIDHAVMMNILSRHIKDDNVLWLIRKVIESFNSPPIVHSSYQSQRIEGRGLPLGNLTSQLLVNIYMNEFDQYVKHSLKIRHYIRYADDFVIFHSDKHELVAILGKIEIFLIRTLRLSLHPNKVFIKTVSSGLDFLGWIHFPHHRILRTTTKRRMLKNVVQNDMKGETYGHRRGKNYQARINSYVALLKYGNTYRLRTEIQEIATKAP